MFPAGFEYYRARTLAEASDLLKAHPDARVLAGGHSLLPAMKLRLASPSALVDIGGIRDLAGVAEEGGALRIGALTTHAALADSDVVRRRCPVLAEAAAQIGDLQVRNRGTIGGSLAHADPAADLPSVMVALGATLTATGPAGERSVPAGTFFLDLFTTDLQPGELLTSVAVPGYGPGTGGAYLKHRHPASSYAVVGAAALVEVSGGKCARVCLVVGGVQATPVRAEAAEQALTGQVAGETTVFRAAEKVPEALDQPIGDLYASAEYRVHLATVLARRALARAVERAKGQPG